MEQINKPAWDFILGHDTVKADLKRLILKDKLPHALLFVGEEGIGKRLVARALVATVLCGKSQAATPCQLCNSCHNMAKSQHPDYIEILPEIRGKGTKLIRMEQIRGLLADLAHSPVAGSRRVVVIDEADRLGEESANSLLKTIEEPTGDTLFILLTGKQDSVLPTVRSRCVTINFSQLSPSIIANYLERQHNLDSAKAELMASLAGGSMARAIALAGDEGAMSSRDRALAILLELPEFRMERIWAIAGELGKLSRGEAEQLTLFILRGLRDLRILALDRQTPLLVNIDKRSELATLLTRIDKNSLADLQQIVEDFGRRLDSNANLTLQFEGVLIRLRERIG